MISNHWSFHCVFLSSSYGSIRSNANLKLNKHGHYHHYHYYPWLSGIIIIIIMINMSTWQYCFFRKKKTTTDCNHHEWNTITYFHRFNVNVFVLNDSSKCQLTNYNIQPPSRSLSMAIGFKNGRLVRSLREWMDRVVREREKTDELGPVGL